MVGAALDDVDALLVDVTVLSVDDDVGFELVADDEALTDELLDVEAELVVAFAVVLLLELTGEALDDELLWLELLTGETGVEELVILLLEDEAIDDELALRLDDDAGLELEGDDDALADELLDVEPELVAFAVELLLVLAGEALDDRLVETLDEVAEDELLVGFVLALLELIGETGVKELEETFDDAVLLSDGDEVPDAFELVALEDFELELPVGLSLEDDGIELVVGFVLLVDTVCVDEWLEDEDVALGDTGAEEVLAVLEAETDDVDDGPTLELLKCEDEALDDLELALLELTGETGVDDTICVDDRLEDEDALLGVLVVALRDTGAEEPVDVLEADADEVDEDPTTELDGVALLIGAVGDTGAEELVDVLEAGTDEVDDDPKFDDVALLTAELVGLDETDAETDGLLELPIGDADTDDEDVNVGDASTLDEEVLPTTGKELLLPLQ